MNRFKQLREVFQTRLSKHADRANSERETLPVVGPQPAQFTPTEHPSMFASRAT